MIDDDIAPLSAAAALRLRLDAQGLSRPLSTPTQVSDRLYAVQAQDVRALRRALAVRTTAGDSTAGRDDVAAAFDAGELVRSWPMRGTLFASAPTALATLLALTADRVQKSMATRRQRLGLTEDVLAAARDIADKTVTPQGVSRAEMTAAWNDAGIETKDGLAYHLIVHFAIEGAMVWGPTDGADHLLVPWTAPAVPDDPDELLTRVVTGYLTGHGPATVDDIAWWTKLPKGQIRRGITAAGDDLVSVEVDGRGYVVTAAALEGLDDAAPLDDKVRLLPAFDEWYLGYQDRSLTASGALDDVIVPGRNGVFRPIIVIGGRTVGTWRATAAGGEVSDLVEPVTRAQRSAIDRALAADRLSVDCDRRSFRGCDVASA